MSRPTPPTYKTRNWQAYNEALKRRGSLTVWFDPPEFDSSNPILSSIRRMGGVESMG